LVKTLNEFQNKILITFYRLKYPNAYISFDSRLEGKVKIKCSDGSKLIINRSFIGKNSMIGAGHGGFLEINNSYIGANCIIAARDKITIAPNCQIAEMVVIRDQNHKFGQKGKTIEEQGFTTAPIEIQANVWLGAKVTVTAGSTIGCNTIVGANAVVRGKLDADAVYGGVPVKKLKTF